MESQNEKYLKLVLYTWDKENNEVNSIFDYSSKSLKEETIFFEKETYLARTKYDEFKTYENHEEFKKTEEEEGNVLIFKLNKEEEEEKDKYILTSLFPTNLQLNEENLNNINNKIWYILKTSDIDNKENDKNCNEEYYLNENDIIKFGRVKYIVQKIHLLNNNNKDVPSNSNDENNYNISDLNKNTNSVFQCVYPVKNFKGYKDNNVKNNNVSNEEIEKKGCDCYECLLENEENDKEGNDKEENFLISLCKCNKLVHFKCFKYYLNNLKELKENNTKFDESKVFKNFECEDCKNQYPIKFKLPNQEKIFNLIDIKEPEDCDYMILESIDFKQNNQYYKSIHIVKLIKEGSPITIGRENSNDIIMDRDISISRKHALLRFNKEDGKISIQNWEGKFGTLVLVKKPIKVLDKTIYLQVGKIYIKACLTNKEEYDKFKNKQKNNSEKKEENNKNNENKD